jgi:Ala-tRNA(Pro) deacylase
MPVLKRLEGYLKQNAVKYEVLPHRQAFTAQETAEAQHVPGRDLAKVVILRSSSDFFMVVMAAPERVDLECAKSILGRADIALATERDFTVLFPECEPGAMPPFGNLYGLPVWVDRALSRDEWIVFNSGTHTETIRMRYADFAKLVQPQVATFAQED